MINQEILSFNNTAGQVYYHPAGHVRLAWNPGRVPLDVVQLYYEKALGVLLTTGARKILSDHGQRAPLQPAAQQWLTQNWIPRAMGQARTYHCAIVEGADPVHRLSTESVVTTAPKDFVFKRFPGLTAAEAWLVSVAL
ncbi:MAG: hypothetical protein ACRYFR_09280 [Janthinobacterium lividum]